MAIMEVDIIKPTGVLGRALFAIAYGFVVVGGLIMTGLALMVVTSVLGRWLFSMPIFGDFEMVAFGTAICVFLFAPYCHLQRGNVIVDLFLSWAPARVQRSFDILGALALGAVAAMLAWRMTLGGMDMYAFNDVTYILAIPLWWAFPFCVLGSGLLTLCCLYTATYDFKRLFA